MRTSAASGLWRNGAFVRLWSASTVSFFGSYVTRIALPFVAILALGAGPIEVAVLRSLDLAAGLLVGLVAGAWVDRLLRRRVMIRADLGRAVLLGSIPVAFLAGWLSLPQLFLVTTLASVLTTFFDAADGAYLPTVVERDELIQANGALAASGSAAELTAFGVGGVLVSVLGASLTIAIDALSFLLSALFLRSIRRPEIPPPPAIDREPVLTEIRVGLRVVADDPVLRALAGANMAIGALFGVFGATFLLFASEVLSLSPAAIGIIASFGGAAAFAGAVVAGRATRRFGIGSVVVVTLLLTAVGNAFIPLAPASLPLAAIACLLAQQLIADSAETVFSITDRSIRQARVRDRTLGRVNATLRVAMLLAQLAATLAAGVLAELFGLRLVTALAPVGAVVGAAFVWRSPLRSMRTLEPVATRESEATPEGLLANAPQPGERRRG